MNLQEMKMERNLEVYSLLSWMWNEVGNECIIFSTSPLRLLSYFLCIPSPRDWFRRGKKYRSLKSSDAGTALGESSGLASLLGYASSHREACLLAEGRWTQPDWVTTWESGKLFFKGIKALSKVKFLYLIRKQWIKKKKHNKTQPLNLREHIPIISNYSAMT